jgi:hypothetical protein
MSVCDKFRQIASETNDEALMREADDLERLATAVYNARVAALGVPKVKPAVRSMDATALSKTEPDGLGDAASVKAAAEKLTAPAPPTAADTTVRTAAARTSDPVREVRP